MIIVSANWGFTDRSLVATDRSRSAAWFVSVRRAVLRAGWRRDGSYRPVERVDLVLAGDTFDWLASSHWGGTVRPWHGGRRAADLRRHVMATSARRAADFLGRLGHLAKRGCAVPTRDHRGRPRLDALTTVPVRVTCLVGDRDAWLDDASPWIAARGGGVGTTWAGATVTVSHGVHVDPFCFDPEWGAAGVVRDRGRAPTLAESLAVDLLVRFAITVRERHAGNPAAPGGDLVATLAAIHPLEWPRALAGWLDGAPSALRDGVADAWRRAVDAWRRGVGREPPACDAPACPWDDLASRFERAAREPALTEAVPTDPCLAPVVARRADPVSWSDSSAGTVVLGHVPPDDGIAPPRRGHHEATPRVVCLGTRPVRRLSAVGIVEQPAAIAVACVGALPPAAGPASVVIRDEADPPTVEWLDAEPDHARLPLPEAADRSVVDAA